MMSLTRRHRPSVEVLEDRAMPSGFAALDVAADRFQPEPAPTGVAPSRVLHTFQTSFAAEVANTIPVSADKLLPLLPDEYELVPAAALGLGSWDQGIVAIANFRGDDPQIDQRKPSQDHRVVIDVLILVNEPAEAATVGVNIPGALHLYTLAIYTNDPQFAASLRVADMPVEFVPGITYDRLMDDASGVGDVKVGVPARDSPFYSFNTGFGYGPAGPLDAVLWHNGKHGKAVLHFHGEPFQQGQALSQIYTQPGSRWDNLLSGGGIGPGTPDPVTGYDSIVTPSLNFRYGQGSSGRLLLIAPPARVESGVVNSPTMTFDGPVTLDSGAFERSRPDGGLVELHGAASTVNGQTVAVLTFTGPEVLGGPLADGSYTLTVRANRVHDRWGRDLDGNGDGTAGGDRTDEFFRLYGDSDGDRDVDLLDVVSFFGTFGRAADDPEFLGFFDFDGDRAVDITDLLEFAGRFGTQLNP